MQACRLDASGPRLLLQGRHIIERDMRPGRHFGKILRGSFDAQIDGAFDNVDGARQWLDGASSRH